MVVSCGHKTIESNNLTSSLLQFEDMDLDNSFAFNYQNDQYYFARSVVLDGEDKCWYVIGFKNQKVKYSFPLEKMKKLEEVYFKDLTVDQKKKKVIGLIDKFKQENRVCNKEIQKKQIRLDEYIAGGIMFTFLLPIALISSVSFGLPHTISEVVDFNLTKQMNKIRLGMSIYELEEVLNRRIKVKKLPKYDYYYVDSNHSRLVLLFKSGKLDAFVRGYKTKKRHEGVKDID